MKRQRNLVRMLFEWLFYTHIVLIAILVIFLAIHGALLHDHTHTHPFQAKTWYLLVLPSTACAGLFGFVGQSLAHLNPSRTFRATFWLCPVLTAAFGITLACVETPESLAGSCIAIVTSIVQALYACWVNPRLEHSCRVLTVSTMQCPPRVKTAVFLSLAVATLYSSFLMCGVGGAMATRTKFHILFIFLILVSLTWTMHVIKNAVQVTVAHVKYMKFMFGVDLDYKVVVQSEARYSIGSICIGSILVPVITVARGLARAVSLLAGDADECMFSCADCCSEIGSRVVQYANRWGFVHVGAYGKGIVPASVVTWEMFRGAGMEKLIESELTSSFCFLSGMAAGSLCGAVGGIPALFLYKLYAAQVAIYTFITGYFINRVAMAWIQSSVAAYYVAYAENPQGQQFDDTIPNYIHYHLQTSQA